MLRFWLASATTNVKLWSPFVLVVSQINLYRCHCSLTFYSLTFVRILFHWFRPRCSLHRQLNVGTAKQKDIENNCYIIWLEILVRDILVYMFKNKLPSYIQLGIGKVVATGPWDSPLFLMAFCTSLQLADIAANMRSGKCERLFFLWLASASLAMLGFSIYLF